MAPGIFTFPVPDGAVRFETGVTQADTNPGGGSVDIFTTTISPDNPVAGKTTPRHATPNARVVLPHLAVKALVRLNAVDTALAAIDTSSENLALWALTYLHSEKAVDGLLDRLSSEKDSKKKQKLMTVLGRLYQKEADYDGSWWWTTRPDTRGPYYTSP